VSNVELDPQLLEIIVCPACRADLDLVETGETGETLRDGSSVASSGTTAELVCRGCGLAYPVRDNIPVLLVDEARKPG
jgi:uncharacterized protein YbaR (Trm112 family)